MSRSHFLQFLEPHSKLFEKKVCHGFTCLTDSSRHPHLLNHQNLLSVTKVFR